MIIRLGMAAAAMILLEASAPTRTLPRASSAKKAASPLPTYASVANKTDCSNALANLPAWRRLKAKYDRMVQETKLGGDGHGAGREFESTTEYMQRIERYWRGPLEGTDKLIAIFRPLLFSYDADQAVATIKGNIDRRGSKRQGDLRYEVTLSIGSDHDTYLAQNGFGASASVTRTRNREFLIVTSDDLAEKGFGDQSNFFFETRVSMTTAQARAFKDHGEIVMLADLDGQPVTYETSHDKPTLDDPTDLYRSSYVMPVTVKCMIFQVDGQEIGRRPLHKPGSAIASL